ncbi:MAG: hypothetical protein ACREHD_02320 [Pirellulales bacterium]
MALLSMNYRLDAASGNLGGLPRSVSGRASLAVAIAVTIGVLSSTGCGPLGLYSLVHSTLISHHVFKPVVLDEAENDDREQGSTTVAAGKKDSSCTPLMPKVFTQSSHVTSADMNGADNGDEPCLD